MRDVGERPFVGKDGALKQTCLQSLGRDEVNSVQGTGLFSSKEAEGLGPASGVLLGFSHDPLLSHQPPGLSLSMLHLLCPRADSEPALSPVPPWPHGHPSPSGQSEEEKQCRESTLEALLRTGEHTMPSRSWGPLPSSGFLFTFVNPL